MIKTIFCLSMPGGHMVYLGLLTKFLLKQIKIEKQFITNSGSAHNALNLFPLQLYQYRDKTNWINYAHTHYTINNVCIIKDGWGCTPFETWESIINSNENTFCLISSPVTKFDWVYSWIASSHKTPVDLYNHIKTKNKFFPIWNMLLPRHKLKILTQTKPIFPIRENLNLQCSHYRFPTTFILSKNFPIHLDKYLRSINVESVLDDEIMKMHYFYISKQQDNLDLAKKIVNNQKWQTRNLNDKILLNWLKANCWEELE